jgi:hypothetical protein
VVTTVEHAFAHGIDDFKWLNHSACWQIFNSEAATGHFINACDVLLKCPVAASELNITGHFINACDVLLRHFAENFVGTPRTLHLENDRRLSDSNEWRAHQWGSHGSCCSLAKETATTGHGAIAYLNVLLNCGHFVSC